MGTVVAIILLTALYFTPAIIAISRRDPQAAAIFLADLFLGWTFLGWIGCLIFAFRSLTPRQQPQLPPPGPCRNCGAPYWAHWQAAPGVTRCPPPPPVIPQRALLPAPRARW